MRRRSVLLLALGAALAGALAAYALALRSELAARVERFPGWEWAAAGLAAFVVLSLAALAPRRRIALEGIHVQRRDPLHDPGFVRDLEAARAKPRKRGRNRP